jgi:hypothetical protein
VLLVWVTPRTIGVSPTALNSAFLISDIRLFAFFNARPLITAEREQDAAFLGFGTVGLHELGQDGVQVIVEHVAVGCGVSVFTEPITLRLVWEGGRIIFHMEIRTTQSFGDREAIGSRVIEGVGEDCGILVIAVVRIQPGLLRVLGTESSDLFFDWYVVHGSLTVGR